MLSYILIFSQLISKQSQIHTILYFTHKEPELVNIQWFLQWVTDLQVEPRFSWRPIPCSSNITMLSIPQSLVNVSATEGTGEATLFQFDGTLETEIELRELPSLNSAVPTPTSFGLFSQFQLRHLYLFFLFLKTHLEMKPFITAHPQTVCGSIIDNESAAKKWKCCFNNLGLKYILLYASKGFNKKSTCRDIFSWLKQQSKAYKCSPTIMTYL